MTISDLIEKLETIKKEKGNLRVCIQDVIETNDDFEISNIEIKKSSYYKDDYVSIQAK